MLIGIDASRANKTHRSSTECYSYYIIKELANLDKENQYILYADKPLDFDLINLCESNDQELIEFDAKGFQKIKSPHNNFKAKILKWPFNFFWTQGRLSLEMLFHRPDILFVPSHTLPIIHPKKSIVTIHDIGFERNKKFYLKKSIGPENKTLNKIFDLLIRVFTMGRYGANALDYMAWSTLYGLRKASRIISVSEFTKNELQEIFKDKVNESLLSKIKVIHNGYNHNLYKKIDDYDKIASVLEKYGIEPPFIFYNSQLDRKDNALVLIEAFGLMQEKVKDLKLVLTGDAGYGFDDLKYMVSEYMLDDKVINTGWINKNDRPYIFNAAIAFVFPSLYLGFAEPILKAMACGTPVAASDIPSIAEIVGDSVLYFNPDDPYSLADKLTNMINNERLRSELIIKGFEKAKKYSWQRTAQETLETIRSA